MYLSFDDVQSLPTDATAKDYAIWWNAMAAKYSAPSEPFSDGCTCAPDMDFWRCCLVHDMGYRVASHSPFFFQGVYGRWVADIRLAQMIWSESNRYWWLAPIYFLGVRLFGRFVFRWNMIGWMR